MNGVIAHANAALISPVGDVGQPDLVLILAAGFRAAFPQALHGQALWQRNLLTLAREMRILRETACAYGQHNNGNLHECGS